jgi:hypothetical protein
MNDSSRPLHSELTGFVGGLDSETIQSAYADCPYHHDQSGSDLTLPPLLRQLHLGTGKRPIARYPACPTHRREPSEAQRAFR